MNNIYLLCSKLAESGIPINVPSRDGHMAFIRSHTRRESSVDFIVRPWVNSSDYWAAYWHITKTVKKRFDEEGISIPFPQRDIHLFPIESNVVKSNQNT